MKPSEKIKQLQAEIAAEEEKIHNCKHDFVDPVYDPEKEMVADDKAGYEIHGVDRWPKMSFHAEWKARWSRTCRICGKIEYTYEQEEVTIIKKPKFKDK